MTSGRKKAVRYLAWLFSFVIMALIFLSSSQNGELSSETSGEFITTVLNVFYDDFNLMSTVQKQAVIESLQLIVRKSAHFTIYFALGSSLMTAISTYNIKRILHIFSSAAISLIYAISDEIHQTFVADRAGTMSDVLINFFGSLTGVLLIFLIISLYRRIKSRSIKKMRKKELMKRLGEFVLNVEKLNYKIKELEAENRELREKIDAFEIAPIEPEAPGSEIPAKTPNTELQGFTVKIIDEVELSDEKSDEPILHDDALEYGAAIIGKITVESAKYCDIVSASGTDNLKELLSLIMGKSEICKSEILNIAMSELAFETKREMIDVQLNEAVEYFKSVLEQ